MSTPPSTTTIATAPFDDKNADVILRTSDNVDFYVYKVVLGLASPLFKDTFSLSQPPPQANEPTTNGELLPVVPFTENSATIDYLLRLCYPITDPIQPTDLLAVARHLEAAAKYELLEATELLRTSLRTFISSQPLRVYAVACRRTVALEEEANLAAHAWRESCPKECRSGQTFPTPSAVKGAKTNGVHPLEFAQTTAGASWVEEMKSMRAGCYHRLIEFVKTGVITSFYDPPPIEVSGQEPQTSETGASEDGLSDEYTIVQDQVLTASPTLLQRCPADIILRCSDGALVQAHRAILQFAAGLGTSWISEETTQDGISIVTVTEDSFTILNLLRLCYPTTLLGPTASEPTLSFEQLHRVWTAAQKYSMSEITTVARSNLMQSLMSSPLRAFFIAVQNGWGAESEDAATHLVHRLHQFKYIPEMESSSAEVLYQLLRLQNEHARSVSMLVRDVGGDTSSLFLRVTQDSSGFSAVVTPLVDRVLSETNSAISALYSLCTRCGTNRRLYLMCGGCGAGSQSNCCSCSRHYGSASSYSSRGSYSRIHNSGSSCTCKKELDAVAVPLPQLTATTTQELLDESTKFERGLSETLDAVAQRVKEIHFESLLL